MLFFLWSSNNVQQAVSDEKIEADGGYFQARIQVDPKSLMESAFNSARAINSNTFTYSRLTYENKETHFGLSMERNEWTGVFENIVFPTFNRDNSSSTQVSFSFLFQKVCLIIE